MQSTLDTIQHTAARVGKGLVVPLLTPLSADGESLDIPTLETLADFLIRSGVQGLNTCGTTGEFALLKHTERQRVTEVVVKLAAGRVPVLAHTGAITTAETVALTRHARQCGADAVSVVTPYYYPLTDQALVDHYVAVSSAVPDFPVFLYNIPQKAGNNLSPAVVAEITRRCPNVVGIKDSSGNLGLLAEDRREVKRRFYTLVGSDHLILAAMANGADGSISGYANVFPELFVALFSSLAGGDMERGVCLPGQNQHWQRHHGQWHGLLSVKRRLAPARARHRSHAPPADERIRGGNRPLCRSPASRRD